MIVCRTLGPVEVLVDGARPPAELLWRKNLAVLIYLARSPKRTRTREHLMGLLWPDKAESAARHSLREAVRVLRRCTGEQGVEAGGDQVQLAPDSVELDVDRLESFRAAGRWGPAAELVNGEFLEGFGVPDASGFEDWLAAERLAWRQRSVEVLAQRARELMESGGLGAAVEVGLKALRLDPLSEAAARSVITGLALAGDRSAALARYDELARRMTESGAMEPSGEFRALADRVRRERTWQVPRHLAIGAATGAESRRAPLVGREDALKQVLDVWAATRGGRKAGTALVLGDAGVGKTRLLDEVVHRARLDGAAVAAVTGVPADRGEPWSGVLGLARGGLLDAGGLAAAQPAALSAFATQIPAWADRFRGVTRGVQALSLGRALSDVAAALCEEQPVVLAVDDAQWLDDESFGALGAALRDLADRPVLVVLLGPEHGDPSALDELRVRVGRDLRGTVVRLDPLPEPAIRALARWALPKYGEDQIERVSRRLLVDSAGLPLLAVELLHAVALGLDLGTTAGAWPQPFKTLEQTLPGDLPDAVVAAIRVGFRRLGADAQKALTAVAVLGDRVEPATIGRVIGITGDALDRALDELEWQRWLTADPRGYMFVARIVRDVVVRDMVTPGQRQRLLRSLNQ